MNNELLAVFEYMERERKLDRETLAQLVESALQVAGRKSIGSVRDLRVELDRKTLDIRAYASIEVVDFVRNRQQEISLDDAQTRFPGKPHRIGDLIDIEVTPRNFGRIAAQTAKQVMGQRIREAEREMKYEEYAGREGDIVTGIIQQNDARYTLLDLGRVEALLPQAEQAQYERLEPGARVKAYIVEVRKTAKGPQIVVSRTHPGLVKRLFELEVPEIADGVVEIRACAREPGARTKIAVWSNDSNVDPVGACVGARGARVRMVVNELRGEKIDIVPFSDDPADFVAKALSPAKVREVRIHDETGTAEVIVPDFQLSLAIGKEGQNARLSARLTGWHVDIKSETQLAEDEAYANQDWAEGEWVVDEATGEQVWVPAEGGEAISAEQWSQAVETSGDDAEVSGDGESAEADVVVEAGEIVAEAEAGEIAAEKDVVAEASEIVAEAEAEDEASAGE